MGCSRSTHVSRIVEQIRFCAYTGAHDKDFAIHLIVSPNCKPAGFMVICPSTRRPNKAMHAESVLRNWNASG